MLRTNPLVWLLILLQLAAVVLGWRWEGRPIDIGIDAPADHFNSLSFAPYHPSESPLTGRYPTTAEIDGDLALLAPQINAIRTYASSEGSTDVPALVKKHGLKMWEGIWLSGDRAKNQREIAAGIAAAQKYGDVIDRVVVGNEVLLRQDLPPAELIGDIDEVRSQISQPVTYADVQDFWLEFPEVAKHVDIITVHLLPYWENDPTGISGAVRHLDDVYQMMQRKFPGKKIAIGETGWPSRGRWRDAAAPSIVNETRFVREFIALSIKRGFEYNLIEAFDQNWKAIGEGTVGSRWGLWTAERNLKIPLKGPVSDDPYWPDHAALSAVCALLLMLYGLSGPRMKLAAAAPLTFVCTLLGAAMGYGIGETWPDIYSLDHGLAAAVNLPLQFLLAVLAVRRFRLRLLGQPLPAPVNGDHATRFMRDLVLMRWQPIGASALFEDLNFIFAWTALFQQVLLVVDGRYRDFPLATFAVPVVVILLRALTADLPRRDGGREELWLGIPLVLLAIINVIQEPLGETIAHWGGLLQGGSGLGALAAGLAKLATALPRIFLDGLDNIQGVAWNIMVLIMALPLLLRWPARNAGSVAVRSGEA